MKNLKDEKLQFQQIVHYYSDFLFDFLKKYKCEINTKMTVLDAGCGHGRNLKLLYSLGFNYLVGIDLVKRQRHNTFKFYKEDLIEYEITKEYDIVLCNYVLMFIEPKQQLKVVDKLLDATNKYMLIEVNKLDGDYDYTCYIQNIYNYILGTRKDVEIIYYSKTKERILIRKWQKNQTDM